MPFVKPLGLDGVDELDLVLGQHWAIKAPQKDMEFLKGTLSDVGMELHRDPSGDKE